MSWMRIDDKLHEHRKTRKAGIPAMGLWVIAGSWASDNLSDGFIPAYVLLRWGREAEEWARDLVSAGLWDLAMDADEPGFRFHDWDRYNFEREDVLKKRLDASLKAKIHRRPELRELVRGRDGDRCRFCGRDVSWTNKRGALGATYEHLDPDGATEPANVVVACRTCAYEKDLQALEPSGMALLPLDASGVGSPSEVIAAPDAAPVARTYSSTSPTRRDDVVDPIPSRPVPSRPEGQGTGRGTSAPAREDAPAPPAEPAPPETSAPADFGRRLLPADWAPGEAHRRFAAQHGLDLESEADVFRAHAQTKAVRYANWDVAFTSWLGKARQSPPRVKPYAEMKAQGDALQARLEAIKAGHYPGADAPEERPDEEVLVGEVVTSTPVLRGAPGPQRYAPARTWEEHRAAV